MKWALLFILLIPFVSQAYEREFFPTQNGTLISYNYSENHKWILEEVLIKPGDLQEKILHKEFSTRSELLLYKNNLLKSRNKPLATLPLLSATEIQGQSLWAVTEQWSMNWEDKFSQWIEQNFDKDFFARYNIATDCADVAFALRWIFARIHGLPAANTLAGSNIIFSQDSMRRDWVNLPSNPLWYKDQKFIAALNYLLNNVFTRTLWMDTYPLEIKADSIKVGAINLLGGHTQIFYKIDRSGTKAPIWHLASTLPYEVRELMEGPFLDFSPVQEDHGGLVRMRWPIEDASGWVLEAKVNMPQFSREQYESDFMDGKSSFALAVFEKLGIPFVPKNLVEGAATDLVDYIKARVEVVQNGFLICQIEDCTEGTMNYENYSTPSRDKRIVEKYLAIVEMVDEFQQVDNGILPYWNALSKDQHIDILGTQRNLNEYYELFKYGLPSYDPIDSISERWAIGEEAQLSAFEKKLNRLVDKRTKLVGAAAGCVGNQSCDRGSEKWQTFNTYIYDDYLKKMHHTFHYLKEKYKFQPELKFDQSFIDLVHSLPLLVSEPNFNIVRRTGKDRITRSFDLGRVWRLIELNSTKVVLNDNVVDLTNQKVLLNTKGSQLLIDDVDNYLISLIGNKLQTFGLHSLIELSSVELPVAGTSLSFLGGSFVSVSACAGDYQNECFVTIFEIANGRLVKRIERSNVSTLVSLFQVQNPKEIYRSTSQKRPILTQETLSEPWELFYIRDNSLVVQKLIGDLTPTQIESNETNVLLRGYGGSTYDNKFLLVSKSTGNFCEMNVLADYSSVILNHQIIVGIDQNHSGLKIYKFNDNCNLLKLRDIGGMDVYWTLFGDTLVFNLSDRWIFYIDGDFFELARASNEEIVKVENEVVTTMRIQNDSISESFSIDLRTKAKVRLSPEHLRFNCLDQSLIENLVCSKSRGTMADAKINFISQLGMEGFVQLFSPQGQFVGTQYINFDFRSMYSRVVFDDGFDKQNVLALKKSTILNSAEDSFILLQ